MSGKSSSSATPVTIPMMRMFLSYRERISLGVLASYEKDPTIKVRLSEIAKGFWQDPLYREKAVAARRKACLNPDLAMRQSRIRKSLFAKQPERRKAISRQMREYLSKPENRAFVESSTRAKPVICVETGEFYPSQHAAETITGYYNIHKACSGKVLTSGGYHWRYAE